MTLTFELYLNRVKVNHHAKYLGQRSFNLFERQTHTTDPSASLGPLKWSI